MIFIQHRLKRDILTAENRFQSQRLTLLGDTRRKFDHMRRQAATPGKLITAFVAGFICTRLRPVGWSMLSSTTGVALSLFEHKYFVTQLTRLFDARRSAPARGAEEVTGKVSPH